MPLTSLIVGTNFRPHAHALLAFLVPGDPLRLTPEPTNPADFDALRVDCHYDDSREPIRRQLDIIGLNYLPLGYIPRSTNRQLRSTPDASALSSNTTILGWLQESGGEGCYHATLQFGPSGDPRVHITFHFPGEN